MNKLSAGSIGSRLVAVPAMSLAVALLSGCRDVAPSRVQAQPDPTTTSTAPSDTHATLLVTTRIRPDKGGVIYIEGALPEVTLVDEQGGEHTAELRRGTFTFPDLEPGTYSIEAALRPCDGNCGYLDPPVDRCTSSLDVTQDMKANVTWRITHPCHVTPA